jgi:glycerol-3-phosphate dehydrogenase (NAD(P)+)
MLLGGDDLKIHILGAGSWGTALAVLLSDNKQDVSLWSWDESQVELLLAERENKTFLPGVVLPGDIRVYHDLCLSVDAEMLVLAVPSPAAEEVARRVRPYLTPGAIVVNVAKGFASRDQRRLSQVIKEELPDCRFAVLSGPSHAEEVARRLPTTVVTAGEDEEVLYLVQEAFMNAVFRVYINYDLPGVEIAGAVKNVIALATGVSDGLDLGDNARAALITRGLAEITRLGLAMGAQSATFSGLAGVGDLIVTCGSYHSRNRRAGIEIGKGRLREDVLSEMGMVVEGVYATENAYKLAQKYQVDMPITEQINLLLQHVVSPRECMHALMNRSKTAEMRGVETGS